MAVFFNFPKDSNDYFRKGWQILPIEPVDRAYILCPTINITELGEIIVAAVVSWFPSNI